MNPEFASRIAYMIAVGVEHRRKRGMRDITIRRHVFSLAMKEARRYIPGDVDLETAVAEIQRTLDQTMALGPSILDMD